MTDKLRAAASEETRQRLQTQLAEREIPDEQNPAFLLSTTASDLLLAITAGIIDPVALAHRELANRGLDQDGNWVGFDRAREIHGIQEEG